MHAHTQKYVGGVEDQNRVFDHHHANPSSSIIGAGMVKAKHSLTRRASAPAPAASSAWNWRWPPRSVGKKTNGANQIRSDQEAYHTITTDKHRGQSVRAPTHPSTYVPSRRWCRRSGGGAWPGAACSWARPSGGPSGASSRPSAWGRSRSTSTSPSPAGCAAPPAPKNSAGCSLGRRDEEEGW